jgi:hypothetical protein
LSADGGSSNALFAAVCPEHGEGATVSRQKTAEGVDFKIGACCEPHIRRAREAGRRAASE